MSRAKTVFIDANILHYRIPTDLFFDASALGLVKVYWSQNVIDEYLRHGPRVMVETARSKGIIYKLDKAKEYTQKRVENLKEHANFILVEDYQDIEFPENIIKDKDDYHILQATMKEELNTLVTDDEGFFKDTSVVDQLGITPTKADDFFIEMIQSDRESFFSILKETKTGIDCARKNRVPPEDSLSYYDFLEAVKKSKLPKMAGYIETHKDDLIGRNILS